MKKLSSYQKLKKKIKDLERLNTELYNDINLILSDKPTCESLETTFKHRIRIMEDNLLLFGEGAKN